ncbi:hypothetical protein BYT27DRAFT_7251006 [Phlegmacium glaucopus]|nr:hypothetical protein BYT27DRAFT_7251006 [Phlegmacium glaucopus]
MSPLNIFNVYDLQNTPYRTDALHIHSMITYCEARFCVALWAIARAHPPKVLLMTECFLQELMFCLSYAGLATAMGHSLTIPVLICSLAQSYEERTSATQIFDNVDIPGTHIKNFSFDWWNQAETPEQSIGLLNTQNLSECLKFHACKINQAEHCVAAGEGPSVETSPPADSGLSKPHYTWHDKIWDDAEGDHCPRCHLYRAAALGVMDQAKDLWNHVDAVESAHWAEHALTIHWTLAINLFFEAAVIKDTNGAESAFLAGLTGQSEALKKWMWGVDLNEEDLRDMVWAADHEFQLPHSGYNKSLANYDLLSDSTGPTKKMHQELNKEIANPPPYEQLSLDFSSDAWLPACSGTKKMWLPAPPTDYVLQPRTCPVGIIYIESNEPTPTAAMIPQAELDIIHPAKSDNPPATIFVDDSDVELPEMQTTSPPPMTVYIDDLEDDKTGPLNSVCLEGTVESDAAIQFADIFVPSEDSDNGEDDMFESFAQTFVPSKDNDDGDAMFDDFAQTFIPGSDDVGDDEGGQGEVAYRPSGSGCVGPFMAADFTNFDDTSAASPLFSSSLPLPSVVPPPLSVSPHPSSALPLLLPPTPSTPSPPPPAVYPPPPTFYTPPSVYFECEPSGLLPT